VHGSGPSPGAGPSFNVGAARRESIQRAPQPSLIEIRAGFEAEVVKTMENM
jgi:hypothetical protein